MENWRRYVRARDAGHVDYVKRARLHDAYYRGDQWSGEDLAQLAAEGRPALTIDLVRPTVDAVLGEHASRRLDIRFKARKGGDQELADLHTKVFAQIADANKLDWVEGQVFSDGLVMDGRGFFDVRISYDDQWYGEVSIHALDPLDVIIDPDAKEMDPKTWTEVFVTRWATLEEIEEWYGKRAANRVRESAAGPSAHGDLDLIRWESRFGITEEMPVMRSPGGEPFGDDKRVRSLRIVERQYRKLSTVDVFLDANTGDERVVPENWEPERVVAYAEEHGLSVFERRQRRIRWTVTCGTAVLHDDWSPYPDFTVIPYFAWFRRGRPFGLVKSLVSPQDQLNKASSQELHVINTVANSGWVFEAGSLVNMDAETLARDGSRTGLVLEVAPAAGMPPTKIPPNQIPTGLDRVSMMAKANMKEISGVPDAMRGTDSPEVSGVAIEAKQSRGSLMLQTPLENLRKSRQYLAEAVMALVQRFYTEERIIYMTNEDDPTKPKEPVPVNVPDPEGRIANDLTVGEYDVVVGTAPARDSFDEMQFAEALSLRGVGVAIPDDVVVEYSHLARKEELAQRIREQTGAAEPTPEEQRMAEAMAEIELRMAAATLAEQEAKVQKLQAEATLAMAKGEQLGASVQVDLLREQAKLQGMREQDGLRAALAAMSRDSQMEQSRNAAASKMAAEAMRGASAERVAKIQAAAKSGSKD